MEFDMTELLPFSDSESTYRCELYSFTLFYNLGEVGLTFKASPTRFLLIKEIDCFPRISIAFHLMKCFYFIALFKYIFQCLRSEQLMHTVSKT